MPYVDGSKELQMARAEVAEVSDARCGRWASPLTPDAVAAGLGGPSWTSVVGAETWWCASRTSDASIKLLRWRADGADRATWDVLGGAWKVATGAIGYGGRPYLVLAGAAGAALGHDAGADHLLVFAEQSDRRARWFPPASRCIGLFVRAESASLERRGAGRSWPSGRGVRYRLSCQSA